MGVAKLRTTSIANRGEGSAASMGLMSCGRRYIWRAVDAAADRTHLSPTLIPAVCLCVKFPPRGQLPLHAVYSRVAMGKRRVWGNNPVGGTTYDRWLHV